MTPDLARRAFAELLGTAFLLIAVVGSGIMAQRLTDDVGLQLLQNAFATACALVALILTFGAVSGAHFNPAVTLVDRYFGGVDTPTAAVYVVAQVAGGIAGVILSNVMFDLDPVNWATRDRSGAPLLLAEVIATFGLLVVIFGVVRSGKVAVVPFAVGAYIGGAYYFTSSTSFANPAVTISRTFSDTFAGIKPASAPGFIAAQLVAVVLAALAIKVLYPDIEDVADQVVMPHDQHAD